MYLPLQLYIYNKIQPNQNIKLEKLVPTNIHKKNIKFIF
jgi:hypothetical protein